MHRVFVYGTLKRGLRNHRFLKSATFISDAHTVASYRMVDGRFPVLRNNGPDRMPVSGEVYDIDDATLKKLDDLESVDLGMYDRIEIDVVMTTQPDRQTCRAFVYIGCGGYWDKQDQVSYLVTDGRGHLNWIAPGMRAG